MTSPTTSLTFLPPHTQKLSSENSLSSTQREHFGLSSLTHNFFSLPPSLPLLSHPLILFHSEPLSPFSPTFLPLSLPPYHFHSPSFPSSRSHPHSLYTWGSCSFIANWTFHSERNNYSLERKGTAVECWYDTQCHLATQELPAHPAQKERGGRMGRERVREREG